MTNVDSYSSKTELLVAKSFTIGMVLFENRPFQSGLAQVFSLALRDALLDELEGIVREPQEFLADFAGRLHPSTPAEAKGAFVEVASRQFDRWFKHIRIMAAKEGVELDEFAAALKHAPEIFASVAGKAVGNRAAEEVKAAFAQQDRMADSTLVQDGEEQRAFRGDVHVWMSKGVGLEQLGNFAGAIECYDRGLELDENNADLWLNKGVALERLQQFEEAVRCYDRGLKIAPRDAVLWRNKGIALSNLGRYAESGQCLDRALDINPADHGSWKSKGATLYSQGKHQEALACFERGLEIDPHDSGLWSNKGIIFNLMGRFEESAACFEKALEIQPDDADLYHNKAVVLARMRDLTGAVECLDKGIVRCPDAPHLWKAKSNALRYLGRAAEAEECLRRAGELGG
jgi:tetratricopeptide (TPR) repeat protein